MKNTTFCLAIFSMFAFFQTNLNAQDLVFYKNGEEQLAKVLEINTTEVKFKKWDNLDGPTIAIAKTDVWMIKYQNGTKDLIYKQTIAATKNKPAPVEIETEPEPEPVKKAQPKTTPQPQKQPQWRGVVETDQPVQKTKKSDDENWFSIYAFGGVSKPTGEFADPDLGAAQPGFTIGFEEINNFWHGNFRPVGHLSYSKNALSGQFDGTSINGTYQTITTLGGFRLQTMGNNTRFYGTLMAGYAWSNFKAYNLSWSSTYDFSYTIGAGIQYKKFDIGFRVNKMSGYFVGDVNDFKQDMNTVSLTAGFHF
jgi:hypothetical protein